MKIQITLFLLFFSSLIVAQDILLFEDTKTETLVFTAQNTGSSNANLRQILQSLQPQHGHRSSFDLSFEYNCRLLEKPTSLYTDFHFNSLSISDESEFRDFSFADLLLPSAATITVDLLAGDAVVHSVCKTINLLDLNQAFIHFNYDDIQPSTVYTLAVKDLVFNYTSGQVQSVNKRKNAINQYYLAIDDLQKMRSTISELEGFNPDPDQVHEINADVEEWVAQFNKIQKAPFWSIIGADDPRHISTLSNDVKEDLDNIQSWSVGLLANIHELYYDKGVKLLGSNQIGAAKAAFNKSINAANDYAPSHYFLAYIDFGDGHVEDAGQRIIDVLNQLNPDPTTRRNGEELARNIMNFYFNEGQREVDAGHFPAGVDIYRHAQAFGQSIRGFNFGQEEAESRIREAYYLDFHKQLDQVVFLQRQGNHRQALINMEQALAFQAEFQVNSNFDTYALHKDIVLSIFDNHLDGINILVQNQSWDEGISRLKETEEFLSDYREFIQNENRWLSLRSQILVGKHQSLYSIAASSKYSGKLDKALQEATSALDFAIGNRLEKSYISESNQQVQKIQESRYQRFTQGGDKARQGQEFTKALNQYEAARSLENKLSYLPTSTSLDQKLKGTALQEIKREHEDVLLRFATNNNKIAASFSRIRDLSGRYHLTLDPDVKAIYQALEDQQCTNAREILLPELERELASSQEVQDYPKAQKVIESIKVLLAAYSQCGLSDQTIVEQASIVAACADYQEALQTATTSEGHRRYRNSLDYYLQAKDLYQNPLVSSRLSDHPAFNTYDYILSHKDSEMVLAGANLYLDQRDHESSLSLLKALVVKGIPQKRTESLQERLGSALAVRHYISSANWKVSFGDFVAKNERKNYRSLQRAFRKQWNRMG